MNYYDYESYYHFVNSYKKVIRKKMNVNLTIGRDFGERLKKIYYLYEDNKDLLRGNRIQYPVGVFIREVYNYHNWDEYNSKYKNILDNLVKIYSLLEIENGVHNQEIAKAVGCESLDHVLEFLKVNYYCPTKLETQIEKSNEVSRVNDWECFFVGEKAQEKLLEVEETPGVYKLYDKEENLVYIGKSKVLGRRIIKSGKDKGATYFSYGITQNPINASIYEAYYIGQEQPLLNSEYKDEGQPTMTLKDINFTEKINFRK